MKDKHLNKLLSIFVSAAAVVFFSLPAVCAQGKEGFSRPSHRYRG